MKVVILAGGPGMRISEETATRPKPMAEIGVKPILWHIMKMCSHYGFNDFVTCAGYIPELVEFHKASGRAVALTAVLPAGRFGALKIGCSAEAPMEYR